MARRRPRTKTRADGEGTIIKETKTRANGSTYERWCGAISMGYGPDGNRKRVYRYGNTQAVLREKLEALKQQVASGKYISTDLSVSQLMQKWLKEKAREVAPRTIEIYASQNRLHIEPSIGSIKLPELKPMHLQSLCSDLVDRVGAPTSEKVRKQLRQVFKQAVRWQLMATNPAEAVTPTKLKKTPVIIWTPSEVVRFLEVARTHRLYALFYLAMSTGLRRGELLSLKWSHIANDRLRVVDSKTEKGKRTIKLSRDVLETLEEHKHKTQAIKQACATWEEYDLVFPSIVGTAINPRNLEREWYDLQSLVQEQWRMELSKVEDEENLKKLERGELFPKIRLHDLRHLHASMLIKGGKTALEVAERLGHTNPSFTMNTYGHIFREHQEEDEVSILDYLPALSDTN